ncbi:MAG: DnaJ domain-containing protein [Candidatus Competibacteraceae bacterium]|nr:DnaJ domain-containing protein [Candidatus Competibacteraceae bacterium]
MNELHKAYAVLGLDPGSSMESIMRRYKRLIMVWHPDRAPSPEHKEFAEEELKKINNAKDVLTKHFGANGGHRASGCDCQAGAGTSAGATGASSSSAGPGPNYHRSKTAEDKYQEEQAAKKRDADRKAREEAEANARRQQEQYTHQTMQQTMESAMQQQAALQDEKLRWQISIGLIIAFIVLEIFGTMAVGAKSWWKDMSWKWQHSTQSNPPPINNNPITTTPEPYIPPEYRFPGGNPTSWKKAMDDEEEKRKQREQKQHDDDVYFTKLEIDKYQKVIEHCNSELTNLEIKIVDPSISEYEKVKLREMRDFRQKNLAEGQSGLKYAQEKLAKLTGETPTQVAPSLVSPITGNNQSVPLIPSNSSPLQRQPIQIAACSRHRQRRRFSSAKGSTGCLRRLHRRQVSRR